MYTYDDLLDTITAKRVCLETGKPKFIHEFSGIIIQFEMVVAGLQTKSFSLTPKTDDTTPPDLVKYSKLDRRFKIDTTQMPRHDIKFYLDLSIEELTRIIEGEIEERFNRNMTIPADRFKFQLIS